MSEEILSPAHPEPSAFQDSLSLYRQSLIAAEQTMQSEYDKAVMTLSGGAIGLSFAFLKDIVGTKGLICFWAIMGAWICWGASILFVFLSFYASAKALKRAIADIDDKTIYLTLGESRWTQATKCLNVMGGLGFLFGLAFLLVFVYCNHPK